MRVLGEYRIDPPLKWSEIKKSGFLSSDQGGSQITDIVLQLTQEERDTDTEFITVVTCDRVIPWTDSTYDPRNLLENAKELIAECGGHSVTGQMVAYDTEAVGYVIRVVVDAAGAREEKARMVWPDGSEVESLY